MSDIPVVNVAKNKSSLQNMEMAKVDKNAIKYFAVNISLVYLVRQSRVVL